MKKGFLIILTLLLCLSVFTGCGESKGETASFASYMLGSGDRDIQNDSRIGDDLLSSDALFAFEIAKTGSGTIQTIYVWNNRLRRELRLDLMELYDAVPDKDRIITIEIDGKIKIDGKEITLESGSDLSHAVLRTIFPAESQVNAQTFRRTFMEMIVRLETLEAFGDTEVIAIQTTSDTGLLLEDQEIGKIILVASLEDFKALQKKP